MKLEPLQRSSHSNHTLGFYRLNQLLFGGSEGAQDQNRGALRKIVNTLWGSESDSWVKANQIILILDEEKKWRKGCRLVFDMFSIKTILERRISGTVDQPTTSCKNLQHLNMSCFTLSFHWRIKLTLVQALRMDRHLSQFCDTKALVWLKEPTWNSTCVSAGVTQTVYF